MIHVRKIQDGHRKRPIDQWQLVAMQPRIASDGRGEMHAIDRMEMCEKMRMSVNVCARYDEADGMRDPVSDMSTRSLVLTHKQHIVDQCCI